MAPSPANNTKGDGLSVAATPEGARLHCVFQKLEGQVTREGLWLNSTTGASKGERFHVVASAVGRSDMERGHSCPPLVPSLSMRTRMSALRDVPGETKGLPRRGTVEVADQLVRFIRPGLI